MTLVRLVAVRKLGAVRVKKQKRASSASVSPRCSRHLLPANRRLRVSTPPVASASSWTSGVMPCRSAACALIRCRLGSNLNGGVLGGAPAPRRRSRGDHVPEPVAEGPGHPREVHQHGGFGRPP